jgi:hypothetical protein
VRTIDRLAGSGAPSRGCRHLLSYPITNMGHMGHSQAARTAHRFLHTRHAHHMVVSGDWGSSQHGRGTCRYYCSRSCNVRSRATPEIMGQCGVLAGFSGVGLCNRRPVLDCIGVRRVSVLRAPVESRTGQSHWKCMFNSTLLIWSRQLQFVSEAEILQSGTENESLVEFCNHFFQLPNRARNFKHLR